MEGFFSIFKKTDFNIKSQIRRLFFESLESQILNYELSYKNGRKAKFGLLRIRPDWIKL